MGEVQIFTSTIVLLHIFSWIYLSVSIYGAHKDYFDLNEPIRRFDLNIPLGNEAEEEENQNTLTSAEEIDSDTVPFKVVGSSELADSSRRVRRPLWPSYVPPKITDSKKKTLIEMEQYMIAIGPLQKWNHSHLSKEDTTKLCIRIWRKIGPVYLGYDDRIPNCETVKKKATNWVGPVYSGKYQYIGADLGKYLIDLVRCNCKYKSKKLLNALPNTKEYFFLHQNPQQRNQYLLFTSISDEDRFTLKLVDIIVDSA